MLPNKAVQGLPLRNHPLDCPGGGLRNRFSYRSGTTARKMGYYCHRNPWCAQSSSRQRSALSLRATVEARLRFSKYKGESSEWRSLDKNCAFAASIRRRRSASSDDIRIAVRANSLQDLAPRKRGCGQISPHRHHPRNAARVGALPARL